jgi:hypothetical protein
VSVHGVLDRRELQTGVEFPMVLPC